MFYRLSNDADHPKQYFIITHLLWLDIKKYFFQNQYFFTLCSVGSKIVVIDAHKNCVKDTCRLEFCAFRTFKKWFSERCLYVYRTSENFNHL